MKTYKYMHTLDGQPAFYNQGEQVCFCTQSKHGAVRLVDSLKQLKNQQYSSNRWREKQGWEGRNNMSWVKVEVDL